MLIYWWLPQGGMRPAGVSQTARTNGMLQVWVGQKPVNLTFHSCGRHLTKYLVAGFVRTSEAILNSPSESIPEIAPLEAVLTTEHVMDHLPCGLK